MKTEQWVMIRTDSNGRRMSGDGVIEHAADRRTVDVFPADAEADDAAGEHVDEHKDPMATQENRLATKQVYAPEAVLGVREEREPGGPRVIGMIRAVVRQEHSAHDVLINRHAECVIDLLRDALIAESGIASLHLDDGRDDFLRRPFRTGFASESPGREQAAIFPIDQGLVESQ